MSGDENLWYVKTADGDVHRVTLDQLDEAFQAGRIEDDVMVLGPGQTKWAKLSVLLGLDEPPKPSPVTPYAAVVPNSLRPVSMDLSLDLDDNAFKKKSRKGLVIGTVVGILAIFGGILFANRAHIGGSDSSAAAAAVPATPPVTAAPPPAPAPPPPATAAATPPPAETASAASKLNDDQKAKLAAADKALEAKAKARKKNRATSAGVPAVRKYKSQGFTTGGSKYDPLNASM
jgi:hypothetical protein